MSHNDDASPAVLRVSRRAFLRAAGLTALSAVPATLPLTTVYATPMATEGPATPTSIIIALDSPLLTLAVELLALQSISVDLGTPHFHVQSTADDRIGVVLPHQTAPSLRSGADLALTVDAASGIVLAVQIIQAWSLDTGLEIQSIVLNDASLTPTVIETRGGPVTEPGRIHSAQWSFFRSPEAIPPPPKDLPIEGWPDPALDACARHYLGCQEAQWLADAAGQLVYCGALVLEQSPCDANNGQRAVLPNPFVEPSTDTDIPVEDVAVPMDELSV
jgi:hypothetical protein